MNSKTKRIYSERLGAISDSQLQSALDTHQLGTLVSAEPVDQGLFGQNIFVNTDQGQFVLRGKPHYDWQFPTEKYFAEQLHTRTTVPVPFPYIYDARTTIFGWPYVIMPRMPGTSLKDDLSDTNLSDTDRIEIAQKQGVLLAEAQKLTADTMGTYNCSTHHINSPNTTYFEWIAGHILERLAKATDYNKVTTPADLKWVKDLLDEKRQYFDTPFIPTFTMQDFKPGNMNVTKTARGWEITGLFDLMECYFGSAESDISRMFCVYAGHERQDLAHQFVLSYFTRSQHTDINPFIERFPIFILHDRTIIWEWAQRPGKTPWWGKDMTFREWTEPFLCIDRNLIVPSRH